MKYSIIAIFMLAVVGCSSDPNSVTNSHYYDKIADWQAREVICQSSVEITEGYTSLVDIIKALNPIVLNPPVYTYRDENVDYWKTSAEMKKSRVGDCEDIAALWYATIREHKIVPDHLFFIRIIEYSNGVGHTVLVIRAEEEELYISNGVLMGSLNDNTIQAEYDLWTIF